jgi:hypothetical protein
MMREVLRIVGDPAGARVSKELLLVLINQEAPKIAARFPNIRRIDFTPAASGYSFPLTEVFDSAASMKIQRVMLNGCECSVVKADAIERVVEL